MNEGAGCPYALLEAANCSERRRCVGQICSVFARHAFERDAPGRKIARAKTTIFMRRFKLIWPVQPRREKYFTSVFQKYMIVSLRPASTRGALRDRHKCWNGMRRTYWCALTKRADTNGEGVWS
jgi:hypothetical protein